MRGSLSGVQSLQYGGVSAYDIADGERVSADAYQPRVIAKVLRAPYATRRRYFQIRTRTTVNMTPAMRTAIAVMAGRCYLRCATARQGRCNLQAMRKRLPQAYDTKAVCITAGNGRIAHQGGAANNHRQLIYSQSVDKFGDAERDSPG